MTIDWHLRFFLTSKCNFSCIYCNPEKLREKKMELNKDEIFDILKAAYRCNIKKIHWTGGEPTIKKDFLEIINYAKKIGYKNQIITTNGSFSINFAKKLIASGINRFNVSIDTLEEGKFKTLTGTDHFNNVLNLLEYLSNHTTYIKLNQVIMNLNFEDIGKLINFSSLKNKLFNENKFILKLISLYPNNPAQLSKNGIAFFKNNSVPYEKILDFLKKIGAIKKISRKQIVGDNPNIEYFYLEKKSLIIGILSMPYWNFRCGYNDCRKLRISPFGEVAACIQDPLIELKDKSMKKKCEIISNIINSKKTNDKNKIFRQHYREQLGECRFGKTNSKMPLSAFMCNDVSSV